MKLEKLNTVNIQTLEEDEMKNLTGGTTATIATEFTLNQKQERDDTSTPDYSPED